MDYKGKQQPKKSGMGRTIVIMLVIIAITFSMDYLAAFFNFEKDWEKVEDVARKIAIDIVVLFFFGGLIWGENRNKR